MSLFEQLWLLWLQNGDYCASFIHQLLKTTKQTAEEQRPQKKVLGPSLLAKTEVNRLRTGGVVVREEELDVL